MTSPTNKPSKFRLQISLRMLLLVMAAVGVLLAVFRWPWEETRQMVRALDDDTAFETRTTYRRGWTGKPIRHGVEQLYRNSKLIEEANYHDGLPHGRFRRLNYDGRLFTEVHYLAGQLHGQFRLGLYGEPVAAGHNFSAVGSYARDEPHGEWRVITERTAISEVPPTPDQLVGTGCLPYELPISRRQEASEETIVRIENWRRGQREGKWQTQTLAGEVLSTAEYRNDELYLWNGQPVVGQFWNWLDRSALNAKTKQQLVDSRSTAIKQTLSSDGELRFEGKYISGDVPLVIYVEPRKHSNFRLPEGREKLVPALCELACENGYAFDCRYGTLWLVPNADPAPAFVDRTGVMQIRFPEGSQQAREWLAEVDVRESSADAGALLADLLSESSIQTANNIPADPNRLYFLQGGFFRLPALLRRSLRRDAIGLVLHRARHRCELQSDGKIKLVAE